MITLRLLSAVALLGLCVAASPASAALSTQHISSDAALLALQPALEFVAEGRIGDLGGAATFETDLGHDTAAPYTTHQYAWVSGQDEPFTLAWSAGVASFTIGGHTLTYPTSLTANTLFLRTRAIDAGSSVRVSGLVLDGEAIADQSEALADGLDILQVSGGTLTDGFTLTGTARLTWTGAAPTQSRLAFQIKVGTQQATPAVGSTWGRIKRLSY